MLLNAEQTRTDRQIAFWTALAVILLVAGYLINLNMRPLVLEEPRRILTALEMLENGNIWAATWHGVPYINKPPLFNWVLLGSTALVGAPDEWAGRLPTVVSAFLIALLMWLLGRRHVDSRFGALSALLWLCSVDILYYFSLLGEIDVFFALLVFSGMASVFHFGQSGRLWLLFLLAYGFGALAVLTKGLPGMLFTGLTVFGYLYYRGELRLLRHPAHVAGVLLFVLIIGVYLWQYSRYADLAPLLGRQVRESGSRTFLGNTFTRLLLHLAVFPLDTLKNFIPAAFFLLFWPGKDDWKQMKVPPLVLFALFAFAVNFLPYQLAPGSRQRYLYPIFPFALFVLAWLYHVAPADHRGHRWMNRLAMGLSALLAVSGPALLWIHEFDFLPYRPLLAAGLSVSGLAMLIAAYRRPEPAAYHIMVLMACARIAMDLAVLPRYAHRSHDQQNRDVASVIHQTAGAGPLFIEEMNYISGTTVYYLHRLRGQMLPRDSSFRTDGLYIVRAAKLDTTRRAEVLLEFESAYRSFKLVRYGP
ncbi:MAG: glycosyltransferase family 39 protein [Saprospiraceae bacterium]|nr:glycosyltransferase family 39 protein [Saprospiraceae bacterium]